MQVVIAEKRLKKYKDKWIIIIIILVEMFTNEKNVVIFVNKNVILAAVLHVKLKSKSKRIVNVENKLKTLKLSAKIKNKTILLNAKMNVEYNFLVDINADNNASIRNIIVINLFMWNVRNVQINIWSKLFVGINLSYVWVE